MRSRLCCALLIVAAPLAAKPLALGDIFRIRSLADVQLSVDGKQVAYVVIRPDVNTDRRLAELHVVNADGSGDQLVGEGLGQPRWGRNGRLAYIVSAGDDSRIVITATGVPDVSIGVPAGTQGMTWSPDGQRLAFVASHLDPVRQPPVTAPPNAHWAPAAMVTETPGFQSLSSTYVLPTRYDLYVVDAVAGAKPKAVLAEPIGFSNALVRSGLSWTPDGRQVLYSANANREYWRNALASDVFVADIAAGSSTRLSTPGGSNYGAVASPDGLTIAWLCWNKLRENFIRHDICLLDRGTGVQRSIPNTRDQRLSGIQWLPDSRALLGGYEAGGRSRIARLRLDGSVIDLAETGGGGLSAYPAPLEVSIARTGAFAYVASDATRPGDVAIMPPIGKARIVTALNAGLLAERELAKVETITYPSPDPRFSTLAIVTRPPGYNPARRYPLMVLVHGGRSLGFGADFDINAQMLAAHGFVVVMPNYRSSLSAYPVGLDADVIAATEAMVARGGIDPDRLYLGGGSGGGVTTGWTIGHDHRFKAAAMWFATVDWASNTLEAATGFTSDYDSFGKDPMAGRTESAARSPLTFIGAVTTPTLLVVGDQDRITPMSQSIMFFNGLQFRNVPSQLQIVPGEPHGVRVRPSHEIGLLAATINWFARFGSGAPLQPLDLPAE